MIVATLVALPVVTEILGIVVTLDGRTRHEGSSKNKTSHARPKRLELLV